MYPEVESLLEAEGSRNTVETWESAQPLVMRAGVGPREK
jgi:hypothetical protein